MVPLLSDLRLDSVEVKQSFTNSEHLNEICFSRQGRP